jgi:hypothetical protein
MSVTETTTDATTIGAAPPAPAPAAPAAPAAAGPTLSQADIAAIAQAVAAQSAPAQPAVAAAAAAAEPPPTSPVNLFTKGQLVTFTYADPYDGETTRYGIVVDTLPDEGAGARSVLAWFDAVSGPIGDHFLAAS